MCNIDRNSFDYDNSEENINAETICNNFKNLLKSKNRFISASAKEILLWVIIQQYNLLEKEQKYLVLIYIDTTNLKEKMNLNILRV